MKVFQLVMKDETNEKRKDDMRKRVRQLMKKLLTTPLLGSYVRIQIFSNFLSAILLPFSLGSRSS